MLCVTCLSIVYVLGNGSGIVMPMVARPFECSENQIYSFSKNAEHRDDSLDGHLIKWSFLNTDGTIIDVPNQQWPWPNHWNWPIKPQFIHGTQSYHHVLELTNHGPTKSSRTITWLEFDYNWPIMDRHVTWTDQSDRTSVRMIGSGDVLVGMEFTNNSLGFREIFISNQQILLLRKRTDIITSKIILVTIVAKWWWRYFMGSYLWIHIWNGDNTKTP